MNGPGSVVVIDAGGANLGSVCAAFARLGVAPEVTRDPARIATAQRLVLPGVGAAAPVMRNLHALGIAPLLHGLGTPLLGICIGMQALFERSQEGDVAMLGLLPGQVRKLAPGPARRLPHMGWNRLHLRMASPLMDGIDDGAHAYFVHGYAARGGDPVVAEATHGETFAAAVVDGHVAGVQFHPERSGAVGARVLRNFLEWTPA